MLEELPFPGEQHLQKIPRSWGLASFKAPLPADSARTQLPPQHREISGSGPSLVPLPFLQEWPC